VVKRAVCSWMPDNHFWREARPARHISSLEVRGSYLGRSAGDPDGRSVALVATSASLAITAERRPSVSPYGPGGVCAHSRKASLRSTTEGRADNGRRTPSGCKEGADRWTVCALH
jgi:hypothetical protein